MLIYIHGNPQHPGIVTDYLTWPYSSNDVLTRNQATFIKRDLIREWFGDLKELLNSQQMDGHSGDVAQSFRGHAAQ